MPGTTAFPDEEIIVEDIGGGGGGPPPPPGGDDDGDGSGDDRNRRRKWTPSPKRYSTAITIGLVSILMFFMALASSFTLESARQRLFLADASGFRKFWLLTTALGLLFVAGQLVAWRQLVAQGIYIASNQASSFFYIFTGAHAVHLLGGVGALLFVSFGKF